MSSIYTGDPTNLPTSITIPSDGDGPGIKAADVNAAFEGIWDALQFLRRGGVSLTRVEFLSTSLVTWTPPHAGITEVLLVGCGGGGGGGDGAPGESNDNLWVCGGGGGAGAPLSWGVRTVAFGTNYKVACGTGGARGTSNTRGGDGQASIFLREQLPSDIPLWYAHGGGGGWAAWANDPGGANTYIATLGGAATDVGADEESHWLGFGYWGELRNELNLGYGAVGPKSIGFKRRYGDGGAGTTSNATTNFITNRTSMRGMPAQVSFDESLSSFAQGGFAHSPGTDSSNKRGGGAGGGGGSGPWGQGGRGGQGGNGNSGGAGGAGGNGVAGAANTGAGGGGGGAGGCGTSGGALGQGAAGGTGRVWLFYVGKAA